MKEEIPERIKIREDDGEWREPLVEDCSGTHRR